jgi:hypothetical protein
MTGQWKIVYDNDTGNDGGFWEWWTVTDGEKSFQCRSEAEAEWLFLIIAEADK